MPDAFITILEAPLDRYSVPDVGDASPVASTEPFAALAEAQALPVAKAPVPIVPYTRPLQLGTYGRDVIGAKRAIWKANGLAIPKLATKTFGPIAAAQLRAFQKNHGLGPDGVLGPETLRRLGPFFDQYAFLLYAGYSPTGSKEQKARAAMVAYALWGYNNRDQIHYALFRPMTFMSELWHLPVSEDCSTFDTKAYKYAGVADPNGFAYNGYGNTGTMRQHGRVVSLADAQPGDLVHYDNPQHVALCVGNGRVVSLGSEIGPLLSRVAYRPVREIRSYL